VSYEHAEEAFTIFFVLFFLCGVALGCCMSAVSHMGKRRRPLHFFFNCVVWHCDV
jgi:hypothetical protein